MSQDHINERAILDYYELQLAEIEEKWTKLEAERSSIQKIVGGIRERLNLASDSATALNAPAIPKNAFKGLSIVAGTKKFLNMAKVGKTTREIADALLKGGYETDAKYFVDSIRSILRQSKAPKGPFLWINDKWELAEWHQQGESEAGANVVSFEARESA